jgi:hypothetical protein
MLTRRRVFKVFLVLVIFLTGFLLNNLIKPAVVLVGEAGASEEGGNFFAVSQERHDRLFNMFDFNLDIKTDNLLLAVHPIHTPEKFEAQIDTNGVVYIDIRVECLDNTYSYNCGETQRLANIASVERISDTCLQVAIVGQNKEFCDVLDNGDGSRKYVFVDFYENLGYILKSYNYEGSHGLLVNQVTGKQDVLFGLPVFSSNKDYFIAHSVDIGQGGGFNPTGFQLWKKDGNGYTMEFQAKTKWAMLNPTWVSDTAVHFVGVENKFDYFSGEYERVEKMSQLLIFESIKY